MKVFFNIILYFLFFFYSSELFSTELINIRYGSNADVNRVVLDLSNDATFKNEITDNQIKIIFNKKIFFKKHYKKNNDLNELKLNNDLNVIVLLFKNKIHSPNVYFLKKKNNKFARLVIDYSNIQKKKRL